MWAIGETFHAWLHPIFAIVLVPTTIIAAVGGFDRHKRWHVVWLLAAGLTTIIVAGFLGHDQPGAELETVVTVLGSGMLIAGHVTNWRSGARSCPAPRLSEVT